MIRHARPFSAVFLALPTGWTGTDPEPADVPELHALLRAHELAARGGTSVALASVESEVAGPGALSRSHLLLRDESAAVRGWASVHDRAGGRSLVAVIVDPELEPDLADVVADILIRWTDEHVARLGTDRGLASSQSDSGAFAGDARQQAWLSEAGFAHTRSWWQMSRPVDPTETPAQPKPGVVVRRVARDARTGLPAAADLAAVHRVLELSFHDHFNYREETTEHFVSRLREDPGHRWDQWWIAEVVDGPAPEAVGALVGALSSGEDGEPDSSYVEYLGVLRTARGRGVATSLLNAVFVDAAQRGHASIGIEVDETSSTGAGALYLSQGFVTKYVTQSWHRELPAA